MNAPKSKNEYGYASPTHRAVHADVTAAVARLAAPAGIRVRVDDRPRIHASGPVAWLSAVWYGPASPGATEPWPGVIYCECARDGGQVTVRDAGPRPRADQGLRPAPVGALLRRAARQYAADLAAAIGAGPEGPGIADPQYEHPWQRRQREAREARDAAQAQMDDFIELLGGA